MRLVRRQLPCPEQTPKVYALPYLPFNIIVFHAWVASSVLAANLINGRDVTDLDNSFMHHFIKALRLINKHISNDGTVDYVAIACVQVLLCISLMIDGPMQTKVHFEGLSRMIQLYGGLKGLERSWFIIQEVQL
jgi:hypothetical protein